MARGKGEGSIYQRGDGYWVGSVEAGRYPNGKRRKARVVRRYKDDVIAALAELAGQARDGTIPDRTKTVAVYLDYWLTEVIATEVTYDTLAQYRTRIRRVNEVVGEVKLCKLNRLHVQSLSNQLAKDFPRSRTRTATLGTLRQALAWAVPELISRNPAERIKTGSEVVKIDDTLDAGESRAVLDAAAGHRLYGFAWLALKYGLRLGELQRLRWADIDFTKGEMTVRKSKTRAGVRTLPLTTEAQVVLTNHRSTETVRRIAGYVFTTHTGARLHPHYARDRWNEWLRDAGITHMCRNCDVNEDCSPSVRRFHISRHTAATLLLEAGIPLEVVSAILGHSNIQITADIYAKVRNDLKRKALSKLG